MDSYKIAFIHQNATIDYVGSNTTDDTHSVHLLEYAKNNYPEVSIFKKLNYRHTPETISYFYTLLGDVIFLNTTKDIERHGYTGLFIFPQKITEEQKRILYTFSKSIEKYTTRILYNLSLENGILTGNETQQALDVTPYEVLEHYFNNNKTKSK